MQSCAVIGCICAFGVLASEATRRSSTHLNTLTNASDDVEFESVGSELSDAQTTWNEDQMSVAVDRFYKDVRVMDYIKYTFETTNLNRSLPQGVVPKVAYLFMVKDDVDQHNLWMKFFQDATPGTYSIYFHQYKRDTPEAARARKTWGELGAHYIPLVRTGWGQLSGAEYALFWEALRDPANAQFALVSEGHVPLKSAFYVYEYLMREKDNSKVCFNHPMKRLHLKTQEVVSSCTYRDSLQDQEMTATVRGQKMMVKGRVRKHHQWLVLARRHAVDVIENGQDAMHRHADAVIRAPLKQGDAALLGASDEAFVATALLLASEKADRATENSEEELYLNGVRSECTSFVYWRHCFRKTSLGNRYGWGMTKMKEMRLLRAAAMKTERKYWTDARKSPAKALNDTPRDFGRKDSQPNKEYVQNLVNAGFLFARKFGKDEDGSLSRDYTGELPPLWEEFENNLGPLSSQKLEEQSRAWPVLDVGNAVVRATLEKTIPKSGHVRRRKSEQSD